jgi:hypothetical protein
MKILLHVLVAALAVLTAIPNEAKITQAQARVTIQDRFASVNGVKLHVDQTSHARWSSVLFRRANHGK